LGCGAAEKVIVRDTEAGGKVYTKVIEDTKTKTLMLMIKGECCLAGWFTPIVASLTMPWVSQAFTTTESS